MIIASDDGWYQDVLHHPRVTVETGSIAYEADAHLVDGDEREQILARAAEADPAWIDDAAATAAVVALHAVNSGPPSGPLGQHLIAIHEELRRELAAIRKDLTNAGSSKPGLGAQLRINCLTFCHWLHLHHTGESEGIFPRLAQLHPDLAPVLDRLDREHHVVKELLDGIQTLLSRDVAAGALLPGFDRLAEELDAHLDYEEEQLVAALDGLAG